MKSILSSFIFFFILIFTYSFITPDQAQTADKNGFVLNPAIDVPDNVQAILDNSCLPCHGDDGNFKAKSKFNWEKLTEMDITKQVSKLSKVIEEVESGDMPKSKYLKKHPEAELSDEQKKLLIQWAEDTAEQLIGG